MHRFDWPEDGSVEFHIPHGEMIRLLRASGFEIEDLVEVRAPGRRHHPLPVRDARNGRAAGRAKRSGRRASAEPGVGCQVPAVAVVRFWDVAA